MNKNKQKWIANKIQQFLKEGLSKEVAVGKSYAMYNQMLKGGTYEKEPPKYQEGTGNTQGIQQMGPHDLVWDANTGQYKQRFYPRIPNTFFTGNPLTGDMRTYTEGQEPYVQPNMQQPNTIMINPSELDNISSERPKEKGVEIVDMSPYQQTIYGKEFATQQLQESNKEVINNISRDINYKQPKLNKQTNNNVMFNPFGGISLEASLAYAGQGFGSGQTGKGLLGSTLAGLKGARTFMSGYATGSEQGRLQDEYKRRMQEEPRYKMSYQEGGNIVYTEEELKRLNDASGLGFTKEGAQRFDPKAIPMEKIDLNLGKYNDVDYFDVLQQENGYTIKPSANNLKGFEEYKNDLLYIQKLNPDAEIKGINDSRYYVPLTERKQEGGEITNSELLTGQYLVEDPTQQVSVELEDGEYAENSETGEVQEVVGEKHDNGGVKTDLPNKSKVISDYTKIGKNNAKKFKEQFNVKVRATDTFATVLDKVNKNIGLDKLIEEEKTIYEKIEEQEKDKNLKENVKKLNLTALQKNLHEISESKEELKVKQKEAFDSIFEEQEKIPKKVNKEAMKEGGSINKDIEFLSKKYKLDKNTLTKLMEEQGLPLMQEGGEKVSKEEADKMVAKGIWEDLGNGRYRKKGTDEIKFTTSEFVEGESKGAYTVEGGQSDVTIKDILNNTKKYKTFHQRVKGLSEEDKKKAAENLYYKGIMPSVNSEDQLIETTEVIEGTPDKYYYTEEEKELVNKVNSSKQQKEKTNNNNSLNIPIIPQDFILPPSARQPVYKQSIQMGRVDPVKVSAEPSLVELERQRQALDEATRFLPPAQRAAMMANALGQTQMATNQAVSQTESTNAQAQYNADLYNLQARAKEDLMNIRFEQDYENKTMAAIGNQEMDIRNYFNDLNNQNRYNFEYIDRRNLLNQAYPQFNVQGSSNIEFAGAPDFQNIQAYLNKNGYNISKMSDEEYEKLKNNR